ncbi:uncharacterized protein LOC121425737 [Lytechinus variegatus]|uniref:uncharacterized protein LOC121425737 n=1 Tax=Lytechinus variegatus TaxID=7654 RepID=UPI001BB14AF6|nr:uncharacterized protein LOC121425737 [Lytechinus variegatus]
MINAIRNAGVAQNQVDRIVLTFKMSLGFDKPDVLSCEKCGDLLDDGAHLSYKVETRIYLCNSCTKGVKVADFPCYSDQKSRYCDDHREHGERVVLFCNTCKREICMMCGVTSHSSHEKEELEKVRKRRQQEVEEQMKAVKIREGEWLQFQKFFVRGCGGIEQHLHSVERLVENSAKEYEKEVDNNRQLKEQKIRNDARKKKDDIESLMEGQIACNNIEARNEKKRIQDARITIFNKVSNLRQISEKKISRMNGEISENTSLIHAAVQGHSEAKGNHQAASASVAESKTKDLVSAHSIPSPTVMKDAFELLSSYARQIVWVCNQKDKLSESNLVSSIWTLSQEHTLKHDPLLCSSCGSDTVIYIDVTSECVNALDLNNGKSRPISQGKRNYTDCVSTEKLVLAFENIKVGLQYETHLSQLNLRGESTTKTTIVLDHKTDRPEAVYAAVNKKGVIMVGFDGSNSIIKFRDFLDPSGTDVRQGLKGKMIGIKGKKIGGMLHATSGGKFVVATGRAEFSVINEYGTVDATICDKEWGFALCGTDPLEDILYVSYQSEGGEFVRIDEVTLNGTIRRRGVVEYKANGMFSEPIVTSGNLLAIRNGRDIRVYKKTPFTTVLSSIDRSLSF